MEEQEKEGTQGYQEETQQEEVTQQTQEKTFTQTDVDRLVEERLAEREKVAKEEAAKKAAKEEGKWQELAQQYEGRIAELEPQAKRAEELAKLLNERIDAQIKDWPEEVRALDPGHEKLDDRLAWLDKGKALAEKLGSLPKAPKTELGQSQQNKSKKSKPSPKRQTYRFQKSGDVSW